MGPIFFACWVFGHGVQHDHSALGNFQKVMFCMALYTEKMLTFVMINLKKHFCCNYLSTKLFILIIGEKDALSKGIIYILHKII